MKSILYSLTIFVLLCLFVFMSYHFYKDLETSTILYMGPGEESIVLSGQHMSSSLNTSEYSISTWVYVTDNTFNSGFSPVLLSKGDKEDPSILIRLDEKLNKLFIQNGKTKCDIENIPIGRWFHLCIVVHKDSTNVYVDSVLKRSCSSSSNSLNINDKIYINTNERFQLALLKYYSTGLNCTEIKDIYEEGLGTGLSDYLNEILKPLFIEKETKKDKESKIIMNCLRNN